MQRPLLEDHTTLKAAGDALQARTEAVQCEVEDLRRAGRAWWRRLVGDCEGTVEEGRIERRRMPNGAVHDYLDGSRIRSGAEVLVSIDGQWIAARYERADVQPRQVMLYRRDGQVYPLDRETMRFRWPRS